MLSVVMLNVVAQTGMPPEAYATLLTTCLNFVRHAKLD
jgi:hypothetical protein